MKQEEFSFSPQLTKTKLYYKKHNKPQKNSKNEEHDKSVDSKNDEKHSNLSSDKICKEIDKRNDNLYQKRKIDKNDSNKKYNDQEIYTFRPKVLEYKGHRQLNNVFERLYPVKTEEKIFQPIVNTMEDFDKLNNKPKKKIKIPVTYKDRRKPKENKEIVNEKTTNTKQREQLEDIFLKNLGNQIFSQLDSDNDGKISIQKINISSIPNEALLNFEPIFEYLQTTQKEIDKKKFHKLLKKIGHENLDFFQNQ